MADLYIPNLMSFQNDNTFLGSYKGLRFRLDPDLELNHIYAEYWYGPLCYELSTRDGDGLFDLTEEGIAEMTQWIRELAESPKT